VRLRSSGRVTASLVLTCFFSVSCGSTELDNIPYADCGNGQITQARVVYVDPVLGNDGNSGTEAAPRATPILEADTANLFKRGTVYRGPTSGDTRIRPPHNADGIVFGAYGTGARPVIAAAGATAMKMMGIDKFTVRDLHVQGLDIMDGGYINLCFNEFENPKNTPVRFWRQTHHALILQNEFGRGGGNADALNIHDETHEDGQCFVKEAPSYDADAECYIGGHWWIIGNDFKGLSAHEEIIDYEGEGPECEDIKIVANRINGNGKAGKAGKILNNSRRVWFVGNEVTAGKSNGFVFGKGKNTDYAEHYQISGNSCNGLPNGGRRACFRYFNINGEVRIHSNTGTQEYEGGWKNPGCFGCGEPLTLKPLDNELGWSPPIIPAKLEELGITW